jgi:hypothetical protein
MLVALSAVAIACRDDGGDKADGTVDATTSTLAATATDGTPATGSATATPGGELTLEEFFQRLQVALDAQRAGIAAVPDPQINDDDTLDATEKASVLANLDAQLQVLDDLRATIEAMNAPDEVSQGAGDLLAAVDSETAFLEGLRPEFESAASPGDLQALGRQLFSGPELVGAFQQVSDACSALQAIANDNDVAITLPC